MHNASSNTLKSIGWQGLVGIFHVIRQRQLFTLKIDFCLGGLNWVKISHFYGLIAFLICENNCHRKMPSQLTTAWTGYKVLTSLLLPLPVPKCLSICKSPLFNPLLFFLFFPNLFQITSFSSTLGSFSFLLLPLFASVETSLKSLRFRRSTVFCRFRKRMCCILRNPKGGERERERQTTYGNGLTFYLPCNGVHDSPNWCHSPLRHKA